MRVLIVGAGIAGLTLAGLLAHQGQSPVVVDRRPKSADLGYAIALWPHGSRVLHALDLHEAFVARSQPMEEYVARDGTGRVLNASPMPASIRTYGHLGTIARSDLLELLRSAVSGIELRDGVSITRLAQRDDRVEVALDDGTHETFDLVVGADGIHSRVRELMLGRIPLRSTGWGCYVWWADQGLTNPASVIERWGTGSFVGTYPCRDRVCVIVGAPLDRLNPARADGRNDRLAASLQAPDLPLDDLLSGLAPDSEPMFLWKMEDVRASRWVRHRVALVGDAAAAFLPTAGIGASMALESAAVLGDELSRTDTAYLPNALSLYVRRRRHRVEAAQAQSRRLARLMFVRSPWVASTRNRALKFASMEQMVGPLIKDLQKPI